jgi:hypothetical protein
MPFHLSAAPLSVVASQSKLPGRLALAHLYFPQKLLMAFCRAATLGYTCTFQGRS